MGDKHRPRRGSMQFWPRKRAKNDTPRIRSWMGTKDQKILGFGGYKAGMTHVLIKDNSNSTTKGEIVNHAVTVIECPPMKPLCLRFYKNTDYGAKILGSVYAKNIDNNVARKTRISSKTDEIPKDYDFVRLVVYTQPMLAGFGKKRPDIFEVGLGHEKENIVDLKKLLEREIKIGDVFKMGQFLDVHSITKGKGFQGTVKRFGVTIRQHKSEKTKRGIGSLGPWHPRRVSYRVPQSGKMGYHLRTEFNKWNMTIGDDPAKINPKGGFMHYGLVKNEYIVLKGSLPGPNKRLVIMTDAQRQRKQIMADITYVSQESKQ